MPVLFLILPFGLASAMTSAQDRRLAVSVAPHSGTSFVPVEHSERRVMRKQSSIIQAMDFGYSSQAPVPVEGYRLPWKQQNLAHPSLHTEPKHMDPCYAQTWFNVVNASTANVPIVHNECLNSLNLDRFVIQANVVPFDASQSHSFLPLHFSGTAKSESDVGISVGAGPSKSSLRVSLADGRYQDSKTFPLGLDLSERYPVTFAVECWKSLDGRDCKIAINGTVRGKPQHFSNVFGNIYNLDGAVFGTNDGWLFAGYLNSLQVCHAAAGGLEQTTFTTTWVENAAKCAGRPVYSESNKEVMCDTFDCDKWGRIHFKNASRMVCKYRIYCKWEHDLTRCCTNKPYDPTIMYWSFAIIWCILLAGSCAVTLWFLIRRLYRHWKVRKLLAHMDERNFLEVPAKIDKEAGLTLRDFALALRQMSQRLAGDADYDDFYPEVVISCPLARRKEDADGCGPGMYHVLALSTVLLNAGIPCFAGLMVPAKDEEREVMDKLTSSDAKCKVLIVVQCDALYESRQLLAEIYGAQKRSVPHILPLSYSREPVAKANQWPMIAPMEFHWLNMRMAVQHHFGQLDVVPEAPGSLLDTPSRLSDIVKFVKRCVMEELDELDYITRLPQQISTDVGAELRRVSRGLLHMELGQAASAGIANFWPEVVITFAAGQRRDKDDHGCGPGLYYALAITIALMKAGIPCLSSLMFEAHDDNAVRSKLLSKSSRCKLLVVLRSEALFRSRQCLREVHAAQKRKVSHILPLAFGKVVKKEDQWKPRKGEEDEKFDEMRETVQDHFCKLTPIPEVGTVMDAPETLPTIVDFVKLIMENEWKKAEEERQKAEDERKRKKEEVAEERRKRKAEEERQQRDREQHEAEARAAGLAAAFAETAADAPQRSAEVAVQSPVQAGAAFPLEEVPAMSANVAVLNSVDAEAAFPVEEASVEFSAEASEELASSDQLAAVHAADVPAESAAAEPAATELAQEFSAEASDELASPDQHAAVSAAVVPAESAAAGSAATELAQSSEDPSAVELADVGSDAGERADAGITGVASSPPPDEPVAVIPADAHHQEAVDVPTSDVLGPSDGPSEGAAHAEVTGDFHGPSDNSEEEVADPLTGDVHGPSDDPGEEAAGAVPTGDIHGPSDDSSIELDGAPDGAHDEEATF